MILGCTMLAIGGLLGIFSGAFFFSNWENLHNNRSEFDLAEVGHYQSYIFKLGCITVSAILIAFIGAYLCG